MTAVSIWGTLIQLSLSGVAALFAWRLSRKARYSRFVSVWLWAWAFVSIGAGALVGGFHQQVGFALPAPVADFVWQTALGLQLLAHALLLSGVVIAYCAGKMRWAALVAVIVKLVFVFAWMASHPGYNIVVYDAAMGCLPLLGLCTYGAWTWKYPYAQWIVAGCMIWLFAAVLQQGRVGGGHLFTPDDLFRAIEIGVLCLLVRGGWSMRDDPSISARALFRRLGLR